MPTSPPFLNPRTPPIPISGLPLYEPSQSYLGTRRGSATSTNSSLSSVSSFAIFLQSLPHISPGASPTFCQVKHRYIRVSYNVVSVTVGPTFEIKGFPYPGHRNRVCGFSPLHCNHLSFSSNPRIPLYSYPPFESCISRPSIHLPRSDRGT